VHDGGQSSYGSRDGPTSSSFSSPGKKDENRRTLTDFKIVGLEIREMDWSWGVLSQLQVVKTEVKGEEVSSAASTHHKDKPDVSPKPVSEAGEPIVKTESDITDKTALAAAVERKPTNVEPLDTNAKTTSIFATPPPSRIRIYFHTPVTADDSRPIPHASSSSYSQSVAPSDSRKGKRKKLEDDDGDMEDGRGPPPPPQMGNSMSDDRSSVAASAAPSVADTVASEGDWLMAAVVEDEGVDLDVDGEDDEDGDQLHVSQIADSEMTVTDVAGPATNANGKSGYFVPKTTPCVD